MTMHVKITKYQDDGYKARILAIDTYDGKQTTTELALLTKGGEEHIAYCTSTRSLGITESRIEEVAEVPSEPAAPAASGNGADLGANDETVTTPAIEPDTAGERLAPDASA